MGMETHCRSSSGQKPENHLELASISAQLLQCFCPTQDGSLCENFLAINVRRTLAEYRRESEMLAALLIGIPDEVMESTCLNGLKPDIEVEVRLLGPWGLGQIMKTAQMECCSPKIERAYSLKTI